MITISRTFTVAAPAEAVFAYLKESGGTDDWDPAARQTGTGPLAGLIEEALEARRLAPPVVAGDRLVFVSHHEGATTTDTITVRPATAGAEVTYHLAIELHGLAKLVTPVLRIEVERRGAETAARLTEVLKRLERSDVSG
jgi:hypothetical protein